MSRYPIPAATVRVTHEVSRSRFIATLGMAESADAARTFIADIRAEMPDASHHVYAFRAGFGSSIVEGLSDDGEPSGTAGPPAMAVLRGAAVGDVVLVVTRYFGGIKLGTGGLVRAYGDATRAVLAQMTTREKIEMRALRVVVPYPLYERAKLLIGQFENTTLEAEQFEVEVTLDLLLPVESVDAFSTGIRNLSAGKVTPTAR